MDRQPVGPIVDGLGLTHAPDDGELISDAVVLLKVEYPNGRTGLRIVHPRTSSWIERVGMYRIALDCEAQDIGRS